MTYREIQRILQEKQISQRELARKANVSEPTISQFLRRRFKSQRLSNIVCKAIGVEGAI